MVNKREAANSYVDNNKKAKLDNGKKDDIAIDSELLGDQSSYANAGNQDQNDVKDEEAAVAAASLVSEADPANAAAAALSHQQQSHQHHHQQSQQQQQQQQQQQSHALHHRMYDSPYSSSVHAAAAAAAAQHHRPDSTMLQPTTLPPPSNSKPPHGSDEWHRIRRENHKEVERRRRDSINAGIKELAALIPTPDTNKAQILQRAVEFIRRLKENENNNIEKWTLEKLLTEQAVSELNASNEKLKAELERAYREIDSLRRQLDEKQ